MRVLTEREGDYYAVEIYNESGQLLIRVGFDHEPTEEEIDDLLRQFGGGDE
jgi:hypothetical protein